MLSGCPSTEYSGTACWVVLALSQQAIEECWSNIIIWGNQPTSALKCFKIFYSAQQWDSYRTGFPVLWMLKFVTYPGNNEFVLSGTNCNFPWFSHVVPFFYPSSVLHQTLCIITTVAPQDYNLPACFRKLESPPRNLLYKKTSKTLSARSNSLTANLSAVSYQIYFKQHCSWEAWW